MVHFERHRDLIFAYNSRTFLERHRLLYKYTFRYHLKAYLFSSCLFSQQSQTDLILVPRLSIENELVEPLTSVDHTQAMSGGTRYGIWRSKVVSNYTNFFEIELQDTPFLLSGRALQE